ncbi:MAG: DUF2804 domain-containing protein [Myxococcales bacterium]|nr:DUF2804 domain-containing protein [Myxococcales bacterium]MCB9567136.1 DUF2804 domain-containing protein [Myxococcales bacterium]MCB9704197.1 DUF2804 domain-containing protein [Myxococcales bacterium]
MTRPLLATPPAWVSEGRFNLGTFAAPLTEVNPLEAAFGPRWRRRLRLKEWQHFAVVSDRWYLSLALFDAKWLALAQICLFDRAAGRTYFYERRVPPWRMRLPATLFDARAEFARGGFRLAFENQLGRAEGGRHVIELQAPAARGLPAVRGRFELDERLAPAEGGVTPLVVSLPLPNGGALYSHKCVMPCAGELEVDGEIIRFEEGRAYALADVHKGFYPWVMTWKWATGGAAGEGGVRGFNLTDNQVVDQDAYNENCLWLDGGLHLLPPVRFEIAGGVAAVGRPWRIRDRRGQVDLTFEPEAIRTVDINVGLLRSRYRGPFGAFRGRIAAGEGDLEVDGWFGMCEDFYLRA